MRLRNDYGTVTFLRLADEAALHPESQELLRRIQAAALSQFHDPAFFDGILSRLEGTPAQRESAIVEIRQYGADAVPPLVARLGSGDAAQQGRVLETLLRIGPVAVDPLLGALEVPDEQVRARVLLTLGRLGDERVVPRIWYFALGADQPPVVQQSAREAIARIRFGHPQFVNKLDFTGAAAETSRQAVEHLRGVYAWGVEPTDQLVLWSWDPEPGALVKTPTTPQGASLFVAERLARQAMLMSPENPVGQALFVEAVLAHAQHRSGWDAPLQSHALEPSGEGGRLLSTLSLATLCGADLLESALQLALEHGNAAAAMGVLRALREVGTPAQLRSCGPGVLSPVAAALDFPEERVQFAAADCVLSFDPVDPFPRAPRVVEILARSLFDAGAPRTVVIDPNMARGTEVATILSHLGYTATVTGTGREGFQEAVTRGDVALAAIHPNAIRWELTQTLVNLRADARTASLPVVVYAEDPARRDLERALERVPVSGFVATGGDAASWRKQLDPVLATLSVPPLSDAQRRERSRLAASWLRVLADRRQTLFDLSPTEEASSEAVNDPELAPDALSILAAIARPSAQRRLAELASNPGLDVPVRTLAARQLATHIRRFGRLLTQSEVQPLVQAAQSESDPMLTGALSIVLGTLETTPSAVGAALQSQPLPARPTP
jgi:CheY-like chemotaxis protein